MLIGRKRSRSILEKDKKPLRYKKARRNSPTLITVPKRKYKVILEKKNKIILEEKNKVISVGVIKVILEKDKALPIADIEFNNNEVIRYL